MKCYIKKNYLRPESIQRKSNFKTKRFVPLNERTKTLKDLKSDISEMDQIDLSTVKFKENN